MKTNSLKKFLSLISLSGLAVGLSLTNSAVDKTFVKKFASQTTSTVDQFKSEFDSWQEVIDAESDLNKQIGAEGFVLLKNNESALPLSRRIKNISLFGKNSVDPVYSGSGSSGGTSGSTVSIVDSLTNAGFNVNPTLLDFYNDETASGAKRNTMGFSSYNYNSYFATAETPLSKYTDDVKNSYDKYSDAAVIVISRTGGEGTDLPRTSYVKDADEGKVPSTTDARAYPTFEEVEEGYTPKGGEGRTSDPNQHYLELDDNEKDLINEVTSKFDKVTVIINSSNAFELDRDLLINNNKVQSIIFAPGAGQNGFDALGKILTGEVTPSGRLTDTFAADFTKDPTWYNFGNNNIGYYADGTAGNQYRNDDGSTFETNFLDYNGIEEVEYEEGIYTGYKYYETRGYTDGETWYKENVNYPFGYGLSYTDFTWTVSDIRIDNGSLNSKSNISIDVTVTNVGTYAGKDVVELYYSAPYTTGKTEKSHVVLGDYAKTKTLRPSESQTVTLSLTGFDMASFDCYDKDKDGHKGYELDAGNYDFYVGKDAHDAWTNGTKHTLSMASDENIDQDPTTGADISCLFNSSTKEMKDHVLSRADWTGTFPTTPTEESLCRDEDFLNKFAMPLKDGATESNAVVATWYDEQNPDYPDENGKPGKAPWYSATTPAFRADSEAYSASNPAPIQLKDMQNCDYDDPKWDEFVSQLTVDQTYAMMEATQFQFNAVDAVGSPVAGHSDGPVGLTGAWVGGGDSLIKPFAGDHKFSFATETLVACTWNKDIAERQGELIGEYGLWSHITGWYAPGGNIHRSPFGGRNFEYYSEDATLSASMMSLVIKGARSKGMVTFMKHFALNDQETNRDTDGVATWADEQTMRENYFKVFEWAVKRGDSNGAMSSFNRIGFTWSGANYSLLNDLLRKEWGFEGVVITDAHSAGQGCMNANQMIRAGNDMSLDSKADSIARIVNSDEANTSTQLTALHNTAKRIFYTVLHSSAMRNGYTGLKATYETKTVEQTANPGDSVEIDIADNEANASYVLMQGQVPAGLKLVGGKITGTIAETVKKGTYTFKVAKRVSSEADAYLNSTTGGFEMSGLSTVTITVEKDGSKVNEPVSVVSVEKIGTIDNVDYYATIMSDGTEYYHTVTNGTNGTDGKDGTNGTKGDKGDKGDTGEKGETGASKSGCGGSIIASTSIIAALGLGAIALGFKKRKED